MLELESPQTPAALDDATLTSRLVSLTGKERKVLVDFLRHLAEVDARRLYLAQGYPSLYEYCRDFLCLSDGDAYRRYTAARLMRRFPVIADLMVSTRLSLGRLAILKDVLTDENHEDLLQRATGGTDRDVKVLAATLAPKPDVQDAIRRLPARPGHHRGPTSEQSTPAAPAPLSAPPTPATSTSATPAAAALSPDAAGSPASADAGSALSLLALAPPPPSPPPTTPSSPPPARMQVEPTSATSFSVRMRVGPEFIAEFEAVKAALSHKLRRGDFEAVMRECFRITLETIDRRRAAATTRSRSRSMTSPAESTSTTAETTTNTATSTTTTAASLTAAPAPETSRTPARACESTSSLEAVAAQPDKPSRYISAAVLREVWRRDEGRCAFVSTSGKRCDSKHQLEVHHLHPYALGGPATEENLSLRCKRHNLYEAELAFGPAFMQALPIWKCGEGAGP